MNINISLLFEELCETGEQLHIEAKRSLIAGNSVMQTICAFANEPGLGGGYLLLGISEPDETHDNYWVQGVEHVDKLLNTIQINCKEQFEAPVPIQAQFGILEGKRVIVLFVPELDPTAKPCTFKGKHDSKNKRKTGIWRRGLNGDYECSQKELEPILLARIGKGYEQIVLPEAGWDDLELSVINLYRQLRARVRPQAEELLADDKEMLYALNLVEKRSGMYVPNIAGLLLMGKPLSLRRLLPSARVDYVRVSGIQWVEDAKRRFDTTLDFREPLIRLIPRLESAILDDIPNYFQLNDGETQRSDQPLIPHKVIREAVVNSVMHRDYQIHQPILIVRYRNRLEICNSGYSLKPHNKLGELGSKLRNPILASVLYDLNFAETKGTGIRTMQKLLQDAGLNPPIFLSNQTDNEFSAVYLLHQLASEEQLQWLQKIADGPLNDNEANALILVRQTGTVDNSSLRSVTNLDTLSASQILRRLTERNILVKKGTGSSTYYQLQQEPDHFSSEPDHFSSEPDHLTQQEPDHLDSEPDHFSSEPDHFSSEPDHFSSEPDHLSSEPDHLTQQEPDHLDSEPDHFSSEPDHLPLYIRDAIKHLPVRAKKSELRSLILALCEFKPCSADELARILKRNVKWLKSSHLRELREAEKLLEYIYPEIVNHPEQAYIITTAGREALKRPG